MVSNSKENTLCFKFDLFWAENPRKNVFACVLFSCCELSKQNPNVWFLGFNIKSGNGEHLENSEVISNIKLLFNVINFLCYVSESSGEHWIEILIESFLLSSLFFKRTWLDLLRHKSRFKWRNWKNLIEPFPIIELLYQNSMNFMCYISSSEIWK